MTTAIKTQGSEKEHRQPSLLDMAKATAGSLRHAAGVFAVSAAVAVPLAFGNSSASARGYNPWETAAARIVEKWQKAMDWMYTALAERNYTEACYCLPIQCTYRL